MFGWFKNNKIGKFAITEYGTIGFIEAERKHGMWKTKQYLLNFESGKPLWIDNDKIVYFLESKEELKLWALKILKICQPIDFNNWVARL
jgi:hypothetical protein